MLLVGLVTVVGSCDTRAVLAGQSRVVDAQFAGITLDSVAPLRAVTVEQGLHYPPREIFLRVFKHEGELELWGRDSTDKPYVKLHTFPVCYASGNLGPKAREGDYQVPEGVYVIERFNPNSQFHRSLGINYPNKADRQRSAHKRLGGDIFIHGSCVSIGCVAITDRQIEVLYTFASVARKRGQRHIPVHIFPTRMDTEGWQRLHKSAAVNHHSLFWKSLADVYQDFESTHCLPRVSVDGRGNYQSDVVRCSRDERLKETS